MSGALMLRRDREQLIPICLVDWPITYRQPILEAPVATKRVRAPTQLQVALSDRYRLERELGRGGWPQFTWLRTSGTTDPWP
jgi:hypothetical protein